MLRRQVLITSGAIANSTTKCSAIYSLMELLENVQGTLYTGFPIPVCPQSIEQRSFIDALFLSKEYGFIAFIFPTQLVFDYQEYVTLFNILHSFLGRYDSLRNEKGLGFISNVIVYSITDRILPHDRGPYLFAKTETYRDYINLLDEKALAFAPGITLYPIKGSDHNEGLCLLAGPKTIRDALSLCMPIAPLYYDALSPIIQTIVDDTDEKTRVIKDQIKGLQDIVSSGTMRAEQLADLPAMLEDVKKKMLGKP